MIYNINYFIQKFEAIPEEKWCTGYYTVDDKHCAFGHCGQINETANGWQNDEAAALAELPIYIAHINDGFTHKYQQPTPKQRVLAALYDLKSLEAVKEANKIISEPQEVFV